MQRALNEIWDIPEYSTAQHNDSTNWVDIEIVIDGHDSIDMSHAGGEFEGLLEELQPQRKQREYHTCQDAIVHWNLGFTTQLDAMVKAYLRWSEACRVSGQRLATPLSNGATVQETRGIRVVDLFGESYTSSHQNFTDTFNRNLLL